jgi:eukaryotic-like serine/threonine-protein kinase
MDSRMPGGDGIPSHGGQDRVAAADLLATFGIGFKADALTTVDASGDSYHAPQPDLAYHLDEGPLRVGRYHLIEKIGRGSQGDVWKAAQLRRRVQFVALKLLCYPATRDPAKLARFRREAERGARLGHAAILPTYEFGEDAGVIFFAMPLIDGFTLGQVLDQRRLCRVGEPPLQLHRLAIQPHGKYIDAMARVLARVAWALHHAHDSGVAHCDVKPSNILVDRADEMGCYLIDFGMGRDLDSIPGSPRSSVAGTVLYMAPEKLLGLPSDEVLCDVYALGATAYEAFALRPPRAVPERLPRPLWGRYLAERKSPRPRAILPRLPEGMECILERALARDPRHRYPSAAAMAEDLERFLAHNGLHCREIHPDEGRITVPFSRVRARLGLEPPDQ